MLIRWSRVIPRLIILSLLILAAWWMRDGLIRWQLLSNVERQTGAGAELDSVRVDVGTGMLHLSGLRLYDPEAPRRELLRVDKMSVKGSPQDLLYRYFRVPEVDIEGIRVVVEGVEGQELVPDRLWTRFKDRIPAELAAGLEGAGDFDWSAFFSEKPEDAALKLLRQFETSRLAEQVRERWPDEIKEFEKGSHFVQTRFQRIKELLEQSGTTEEKIRRIGEVLKELEETDGEIQKMFGNVTRLKKRAQGDYQSLVDAVTRDQESLKTIRAPDVDTSRLSETLIGPEIRQQWDKTVAWGDWARSLLVPVDLDDGVAPIYERFGLRPPEPVKGETIHLTALDARPELLLETVNLTGQVLFGTLPVYFNGTVRNVAHPMSLGPDPTVAQFCFSGKGVPVSPLQPLDVETDALRLATLVDPETVPDLYVTLSVDRLGRNDEDQLIVHCPLYRLPERLLGDPNRLAVAVSPGNSSLDGVLLLQGEKLSGQIRVVQQNVRLTVHLPENLRQSSLHRFLQQALDSVDGFTAEIQVAGTRSEPVYAFKSNLAEKIGPTVEALVRQEWDNVRLKASEALSSDANQAVETLNAAIREKIDPILGEINTQRTHWEQQIAQGAGVPLDRLAQSQMSQLSEKDRQRLNQFMRTPTVQALIQQNGAAQNPSVEQTIQQGVDRLQEKLPGLLERLKKK